MVLCKAPLEHAKLVSKHVITKHGSVGANAGAKSSVAAASYHVTESEEKMIQFILDASSDKDCFADTIPLPAVVEECFVWMKQRSAAEAMQQRELITQAIERDGLGFFENGAVNDWFGDADNEIRRICKDLNGPLLGLLLQISGHGDKKCADLCRHGAPLLGKLPTTRNGNAEKTKQYESLESLFTTAQHGNKIF